MPCTYCPLVSALSDINRTHENETDTTFIINLNSPHWLFIDFISYYLFMLRYVVRFSSPYNFAYSQYQGRKIVREGIQEEKNIKIFW